MEWLSNLNLAACALICFLGVLILLIMTRIVRSRFMVGLVGAVVGLSELWSARRQPPDEEELVQQYRRSTGRNTSAQSRVQEIRARYDREFHGEQPDQPPYPAMPPPEQAPEQAQDVQDNSRRRYRREKLDYDDEMDAFFDDSQL
ncbi:hypothetical protein ACFLYO_00205 [Chloroflexota bacterium]